jgi:hypothetical protein
VTKGYKKQITKNFSDLLGMEKFSQKAVSIVTLAPDGMKKTR